MANESASNSKSVFIRGLTPEVHNDLKKLAQTSGQTLNDMLARVVTSYASSNVTNETYTLSANLIGSATSAAFAAINPSQEAIDKLAGKETE